MLQPGKFTELFFLDDATALAAGHRPCALCRREDYNRLVELWRELHPGQVGADAIDLQLHGERLGRDAGGRLLHRGGRARPPRRRLRPRGDRPALVLGSELMTLDARRVRRALGRRPRAARRR